MASAGAGAGERMTGDELRALLSDATTFGEHAFENISGKTYRRADGTYVGKHSKKGARRGNWNVAGDAYCRHPEGEKNGCGEVQDNGDGTYSLFRAVGGGAEMRHVWNWIKVTPGNPENL